jgi:hypothetical protein
LEKGKELATKDADKEPFFDDTKFSVELLRSTFRNLEGVGAAFDIKAHHDVYKDPSVKGPDGDDGSHNNYDSHDDDDGDDGIHGGDNGGTLTN